MGVLDQRAGFDRGADSGGNRRPCVGPTAQTGHRLPWDPGHRCGHDRFDHGHKLGGTTYAWGSATIVGLLIGAAVALGFFVWLEGRAAAAILPPRLFGSPVFAVCCVLSFVVGFAMLGALTFVPIYLGYVDGASATASGLRTLPMVIGLLIASTGTGVLVGRTGRYKIFPVAGWR